MLVITSYSIHYTKLYDVAGVTRVLAENNANIVDIRQTIMEDLFTMIMMADISNLKNDLAALKSDLEKLGSEIGVKTRAWARAARLRDRNNFV